MSPWLFYAAGVLTPVVLCLILALWLWVLGQLYGPEPESDPILESYEAPQRDEAKRLKKLSGIQEAILAEIEAEIARERLSDHGDGREWVNVHFQASPRLGESVAGVDLREVAARLGDAFGFELVTGVTVTKLRPRQSPATDAYTGGVR